MAGSVSVVIPTHNRSGQVLAAVASATAQEPPPLEVLVCDNGSTDDTAARVSALAERDPRVRLLRRASSSGGPAAPRNLGLAAAAGDWVAFLDDDDAWLPGKLASQARWFDRADLIGANARLRSDGSPYFPAVPGPDRLPRENILITSSVVVRAELLRAVGGFPEGRRWTGVEDYGAWLRLHDRGARVALLDEILVDYRDEGGDRFGAAPRHALRQLTRLHLRRWAQRPFDPARGRLAANAVHAYVRR